MPNELAHTVSNTSAGYDETSGDPDDFYRDYQGALNQDQTSGLRQDALRTANLGDEYHSRTRKSSVASTASQDRHVARTSRTPVGSRRSLQQSGSKPLVARKSSFKDLVARFDASPDDVPPIPPYPTSMTGSRKASPVLGAGAQGNTWKYAASASMSHHHQATLPEPPAKKSRPLFGEILPGAPPTNGAGYGIQNARRRRGSEGSPMHSPNPMFPDSEQPFYAPSHLQRDESANGSSRQNYYTDTTAHRRAASDLSPSPQVATDGIPTRSAKTHGRQASASRIPLSTRRLSVDSGSGTSTPSSRVHSRTGQHPSIPTASRTKIPTPTGAKAAPSSFNHKTLSPIQIRSPGRHGRNANAAQGQKSPSLRANIIAPPPKISPPLRSSRPRLPVSSASTTASRAKIAERFQTMAKEQTDRRSASRRMQPPELSDIDLKQRRLKITQALSRSREGQELRGEAPLTKSTSRNVTPSLSDADRNQDVRSPPNVPAVVVESASFVDEGGVFSTPDEESSAQKSHLTQEALSKLSTPGTFQNESDSPTLGSAEEGNELDLPRLQIPETQRSRIREEDSALTHDTAETTFDAEPQVDTREAEPAPHLSILDQVRSIREPSSASSPSGVSPLESQSLDRTDAESVNLVLRNTTYMDEDEAVAKGYRTYMQPPPLPDLYEGSSNGAGSWTSSIAPHSDASPRQIEERTKVLYDSPVAEKFDPPVTVEVQSLSSSPENGHESVDDIRATAASDAYTIVNIILQQRSNSGIVDQQLVDDIYERIITEEPELALPESVDPQRIEEICLQELEQYGSPDHVESVGPEIITGEPTFDDDDYDNQKSEDDERRPPPLPKDNFPPPSFRTHNYKSSLDSAEDWADTSPSVGDWMQFALARTESDKAIVSSPLARGNGEEDDGEFGTVSILQQPGEPPVPPKDHLPSPPAHSPPPPPGKNILSGDQSSLASEAYYQASVSSPPEIPHRFTSASQMSTSRPMTRESSTLAPSLSIPDEQSADVKRLKQRRNIMKELVDTEFTYERDMRVLCDIYKQTAIAVLSEEDVKVIFGNVEQIQQFSKDFLTLLKQVVKPVYVMDRKNRTTNSHMSDRASLRSISPDLSDDEKDRLTQVGHAFEASIEDMSAVYTDYIRQRHGANKRLTMLQSSPAVMEWLRECSENSKDITHAWDLDALCVKPVQRITKYPLLLSGLLEATPADHPDIDGVRRALSAVTDANFSINDIKKQTELLDQVLNRRRKDSDVRNGLTKAFGRRAERLRQHVGVSDVHEDGEYARLRMDYDNNGVHLLIVSKDCQGYLESIKGLVQKWHDMALAAEGWVDVGHSNHPEAESKLRQLAMAVRGISTIALPDHIDQVSKKVIQPMEQAMLLMERFKMDPKGLLQKREKKILDYSTARNRKDRGEKLDRKMTERLDQWEAINTEVKQRMRKLLQSTQTLVHSCLHSLVHLHMSWLAMIKQKLAAAMTIPLERLDEMDLVKDWQVDHDFQEATALTLSICNGALLAEAANIPSFLSPGSTVAGEDSPRPSWNSGNRTTSLSSDHSHVPPEKFPRYSSGQHSAYDGLSEHASTPAGSARMRATSTTSGRVPSTTRTPDMYNRTPSSTHVLSRPATSLGQVDRPGQAESGSIRSTLISAPRVSLDTPSPSIGPLAPLATPDRPDSASTFFSATAGPSTTSHTANNPSVSTTTTVAPSDSTGTTAIAPAASMASGGSSIFSSAMPMPDSPVAERGAPALPPGITSAAEEEPSVLFTAASVYEFNIDRARQEGGIPYLTYVAGEIFDVIGERGELWLAKNQDDPSRQVGWIWCKHFAKLAT